MSEWIDWQRQSLSSPLPSLRALLLLPSYDLCKPSDHTPSPYATHTVNKGKRVKRNCGGGAVVAVVCEIKERQKSRVCGSLIKCMGTCGRVNRLSAKEGKRNSNNTKLLYLTVCVPSFVSLFKDVQYVCLCRRSFASALERTTIDKVKHNAIGQFLPVLIGWIGSAEFC